MPHSHRPTEMATASPAPIGLRVDDRKEPDGGEGRYVAVASHRRATLSWTVPLLRPGQRQTAWEVDLETLAPPAPRRRFSATSPAGFTPTDLPLAADTVYRYRVRIRDEHRRSSAWSTPRTFETGPFDYGDWTARWLTQPALETRRTRFVWTDDVARARVRFAAQGLARVEVNGEPVNPDGTDPSRTDIVRALYRSYDITDLIQTGSNTFDITLATGPWTPTGLAPRVLAEIVVESKDGTRSIFPADDQTEGAASEVVEAAPFYLERHDASAARRFATCGPVERVAASRTPESAAVAPTEVTPDPAEPIRNVRRSEPREISRLDGVRVFDVGVNIAGRVEVTILTPHAGERIRLVHGEHLGVSGRVDTTNLTLPTDSERERQVTEFSLTGEPGQRLTPWFAYQGFRYVEVAGLDDDAGIEVAAWTHHSDLTTVTTLSTDAPIVDRLLERAERTLLNNVHGIPEDCPTREQAGWTGDTASVTEMEFGLFDMSSFFRKWLGDLRTSQGPDGAIPAIAPRVGAGGAPPDPVWGAALQRVLIGHWHHYGDRAVVEENLPALRRWTEYQLGLRGDTGVIDSAPISYGHDWLALEQTPPPLLHTNATLDCLMVLAELEELVGDPDEARRRHAQADELRQAARRVFYDASTGAVANGSQASLAIAVESGMLTGPDADGALERLVADIRGRGNRVSSGFAATRTVVRALARHGFSQVVFDMLGQPEEPGIGAMLDHGPGTFWECWWIDPSNTGTGSLDHIGLGGPFAGWALQFLAGVRPTAGGFSRWELAPQFVAGVDRLHLTTETVAGPLVVDYERTTDRVEIEVTVPVGTAADVRLPGEKRQTLGAGRHRLTARTDLVASSAPATPDPASTAPWRPPSRAPRSADVDTDTDWRERAVAAGPVLTADADISIISDGVVCMPVPHAQPSGPVIRVIGRRVEVAPRIRIEFPDPVDLGTASFVYALVDLCLANSGRAIRTWIAVHGANGTTRRSTARIWPAGWNRVSVDLDSWSGASEVTAVEVGLEFTDDPPEIPPAHPAAFHLGPVGWSTAKRLW